MNAHIIINTRHTQRVHNKYAARPPGERNKMIFLLREMRAPSKARLLRGSTHTHLIVWLWVSSLALGQPHYHAAYKITARLNMEQLMTGFFCLLVSAGGLCCERSKKHTNAAAVSFFRAPPSEKKSSHHIGGELV